MTQAPQPRFAWSRPERTELIDAGFMLVLGIVALYGFHDTYAGSTYLLAGTVGLALGIALALVANGLRQPVIVLAVFSIAAFFLLGGAVALHGDGAAAILPLPDTLVSLADQSVHGWKELLTTLPPVDGGPLLTLPYLLGLVSGAGAVALAGRTRSAAVPALAPVALLVAVILLGVHDPEQVLVLGGAFGAILVAWVVVRSRRLRTRVQVGERRNRQRLTGLALCVGALAGALVIGPGLPGTDGDRIVLRTYVEPPFDIGKYPSPLAGFRRYTTGADKLSLHDKDLLRVSNLAPGTLVRFATMDAYDGSVWGASNNAYGGVGAIDTFQKVGTTIANPAKGTAVRATVEVLSPTAGVWLPTVGDLTGITFSSPRLEENADDFRYNIASSTGVVPGGLRPGDSYQFESVLTPQQPLDKNLAPVGQVLPGTDAGAKFGQLAGQWARGESTPMGQVLAVAKHLHDDGTFTHGGDEYPASKAGHSLGRLTTFATGPQIIGDEEQYTALMALMANQLQVPARVVIGAPVPAGGVIKGKNVTAWVEVRTATGWQTLPASLYVDTENNPPKPQPPPSDTQQSALAVPPPVPVRPPSTAGDPIVDALNRQGRDGADSDGFRIPGIVWVLLRWVLLPLALVMAVLYAVAWVKERRRRRRRTRGTESRRLAMGYREVLDQARDLGHTVYDGATRREQAAQVGLSEVAVLARDADSRVFGSGDLGDEDVDAYWAEVDRARAAMVADLSRWERLKAAVNLASFRPLPQEKDEA